MREFKLGLGLYTVDSRYCVYTNERDHMWQTESILLTVVTSLCKFFQYLPAILKHKHCTLFSMLQDQYIFIHDAILESVTCGDTQIEAGNLRRRLTQLQKKDDSGRTGFELQFSVSTQCGIMDTPLCVQV